MAAGPALAFNAMAGPLILEVVDTDAHCPSLKIANVSGMAIAAKVDPWRLE